MLAPADTAAKEAGTAPVAYVLDDDSAVGGLVERMLRAEGYAAVAFSDPTFCLQQLAAAEGYGKPALILLDLALGRSDGIEVIDRLKSMRYRGKVLLISGKDEQTVGEVQAMGSARGLLMLPSLGKPFRLEELRARLKLEPDQARPQEEQTIPAAISLEGAIGANQLLVRYQPHLDLKAGVMTEAEVVLYTHHAVLGLLPLTKDLPPPGSSIYHPLSRMVVRQVLEDWSSHFSKLKMKPRLSIALPLPVVASQGFLRLIQELLPKHPRLSGLRIQLRDWRASEGTAAARAACTQLKLYGIDFSVEDIGAIYASVAQNQPIPFSELRLLPQFTANCASNADRRELCADAIRMAHRVGAVVCATGIADREHLQIFHDLSCDLAQGHVLGAPKTADEALAYFESSSKVGRETAVADPFAWPEEPGEETRVQA